MLNMVTETAMNKIQDHMFSDQWLDKLIHYHMDNITMVQFQ